MQINNTMDNWQKVDWEGQVAHHRDLPGMLCLAQRNS